MTLSKFGMKGREHSLCKETADQRDELAFLSGTRGRWTLKDQLWLRLDEASQNIPKGETCVG